MKIESLDIKEFDKFYTKLEQDFCIEERKTKENEKLATKDTRFSIYNIIDENEIVGYVTEWNFDKFIFLEHFAIDQNIRGKGIGTRFLSEYLTKTNVPVVLEIEEPTDLQKQKRKAFYEKLGFKPNKYKYIQPSYHEDDSMEVPMILMSYSKILTKSNYDNIVKTIKQVVYNK